MMVPCPLCLADHELNVCKVLGPEKHKGHEILFLLLFSVIWEGLKFFGGGGFLPIFMYHKRCCGLSL